MRKWVVIIIIVAVLLGYNYIYQDHRDIESETAAYTLSAQDISNEFEINPSESETKYLNKTIVISGKITELGERQVTLNGKVFCQLNKKVNALKLDQYVKIKGRFIGYDNLLEETKLDQCYIIN